MTRIEAQILKSQKRIAKIRARERKLKALRVKKQKVSARRRGRPKLDGKLLEKVRESAKTKSFSDVALKYDVSVQSLYNYGISRSALNAEAAFDDLQRLYDEKHKP